VFNDDNIHTVLTSFEMLVLRITYAPELRSDMSLRKVTNKHATILSVLTPQGDVIEPQCIKQTDNLWKKKILKISTFTI